MDRYQLLAEQGTGSYAVVWRARDKQTGQVVAIKELKEDFPRCVSRAGRPVVGVV